jgi:lipopolysaccharide/colanic/teichoic acid biosynthesis glycosyltransferase
MVKPVFDLPVKRAIDLLALALLAPFAISLASLVALAVLLDSPGPVIYRAARVGRGGRSFEMLKFRTMRVGVAGHAIAGAKDLRITPVGRFLRASRLDELPQLWNVLRGEMSLVGPRPELEEFVRLHAEDYREILAVPPGMTGATQLRYAGMEARTLSRHEDPEAYYRERLLPDKVALDLAYARSSSQTEDLKILIRTFGLPAILLWQRIAGDASAGRSGRSIAYAGVAMAVAILPLMFAIGLGSPR